MISRDFLSVANNLGDSVAFNLESDTMKEPEIIGVGRLVKRHGVPEAEFAIEISDRFQRQGLGTHLLQLLVDIGRQEGLERIFGLSCPENYSMLHLAKKVGFTVTFDHLETVNRAELKLW